MAGYEDLHPHEQYDVLESPCINWMDDPETGNNSTYRMPD